MESNPVCTEIKRLHAVEEDAFLHGDQETMHVAGGILDEIVTDETLLEMKGDQ